MKYRPEIDGLRAVAVVPVLFFHAGFSGFSGGFIGVDIFFVISGYLIASIIMNDQNLRRFSLLDFYERRLRRIAPMVFTVCLATIPFAWAWMIPSEYNDYSKSLYSSALSFSNFNFWQQADYFAPSSAFQPLLHTWSLGIEFQFYLLFPIIIIAFQKHANIGILILIFISFLLPFYVSTIDAVANFYLLPTRFWELGVGALVALNKIKFSGKNAEAASLLGLGIIVLSILSMGDINPHPGIWTALPVLGTAAILASHGETFTGKLLSQPHLVTIGLMSFSIYLWHQPIFVFTRIRIDEVLSTETYLILMCITLLLSYFSWRWIEKPFRNNKIFSRKLFASLVVYCFTPLVVFAAIGDVTNGLTTARTSNIAALSLNERLRINQGLGSECDGRIPLSGKCQTHEEPEIVVWGDSFAMHLVQGIITSKPDVRLLQITKSACAPILGISSFSKDKDIVKAKKCIEFNSYAKDYINSTKTIKYAVLSSTFGSYSLEPSDIMTTSGRTISNIELPQKHLQETISWLKSINITPVIFLPTPRDGSEVSTCVSRAIWMNRKEIKCDMAIEDVNDFLKPAHTLLNKITIKKIDIADVICDNNVCKPAIDGVSIFRDSGHLSFEGSAYLGKKMGFYDQIIEANTN